MQKIALILTLLVGLSMPQKSPAAEKWPIVSSSTHKDLKVYFRVGKILDDEFKQLIEVHIFLENEGASDIQVLTNFSRATVWRTEQKVTVPLIFGTSTGVAGPPIKKSLDGWGAVMLRPRETTETTSFRIQLLPGEDPDHLLKKLRVLYSVQVDDGIVYDRLWTGRLLCCPSVSKKDKD